jgi:hypothetical protein
MQVWAFHAHDWVGMVSRGIEYKITQDKGTHAVASGLVYSYGLGPFWYYHFLFCQVRTDTGIKP